MDYKEKVELEINKIEKILLNGINKQDKYNQNRQLHYFKGYCMNSHGFIHSSVEYEVESKRNELCLEDDFLTMDEIYIMHKPDISCIYMNFLNNIVSSLKKEIEIEEESLDRVLENGNHGSFQRNELIRESRQDIRDIQICIEVLNSFSDLIYQDIKESSENYCK
ncbi:MAG: hypothetical protein R3Y13_00070 [bacterium]